MSKVDKGKIEALKEVLKALHRGESIGELKQRFKDTLKDISPFEIPLVEQELIREGIPVEEILELCDLHVELLRDALHPSELKDVPKGHPLDTLSSENEYIVKLAESLNVYANILSRADQSEAISYLKAIRDIVAKLRGLRLHYRKIQMLIFPYLERRGITAIPRVLWSREDQIMVKLRELSMLLEKGLADPGGYASKIAGKAMDIAREISDLVFREEKILFPAIWILLSEGEWAAIHEVAMDIGYLVSVDAEWIPRSKPILPYEVNGVVPEDQIEKLPQEFRSVALAALSPDTYRVRSEGDIEFKTGFLSREEVEALFKHLPIEVTYADENDRVVFFSESISRRGFTRTKTIIGRRIEYCHPPRLERFVRNVVDELKSGRSDYKEYWTGIGNRIVRVIVSAVRDNSGRYLGILEIVEDLTDVVNNPDEVRKMLIVL
jgi:PAS domain S-box-containing protein